MCFAIENYGKVLGHHKTWYFGGTYESAAVSGEVPNKKVSDVVIKIDNSWINCPLHERLAHAVFVHEFEADDSSKY